MTSRLRNRVRAAPVLPSVSRPKANDRSGQSAIPPIVQEVVDTPGQPLDRATRDFMEPRFDLDFSEVRVHADAKAVESAQAIAARAYVCGSHVVLGRGGYAPATWEGKQVLAHELTHVVQHERAPFRNGPLATRSRRDAPDELQAQEVSARVMTAAEDQAVTTEYVRPSADIRTLDIRPDEPATAYLPDSAELETRLTAMTAEERATFITTYFADVKSRWDRADAAGLIAMLDKVRSAEKKMAKSAVKPVAGLPRNAPTAHREYLMLDAGGAAATKLGRQLVLGEVTAESTAITAAAAGNAVMNLRRLDDALTRILSAHAAATKTGVPLEDVLAMYRVEGDLNAPPSKASLAAGIPSGTSDATTSLNPRPDISHLVWLVNPSRVPVWSAEGIKEFALVQWFVQIGGLDEVGMLPRPKRAPFVAWSSQNWLMAAGIDPGSVTSLADVKRIDEAKLAAGKRWDGVMATMELEKPTSESGTSEAIKVTPRDPEMLVSGILAEAVIRQSALRKTSSLLGKTPKDALSPEMTKGMSYLHYHAGADQMKQIIVSAVIAASRTSGGRFKSLRDAMVPSLDLSGLKAKMASFDADTRLLKSGALSAAERATLEAEVATLIGEMWTAVSDWLKADASRLTLLSRFIETADAAIWTAWTEHRGNLSRYSVLKAYYELL